MSTLNPIPLPSREMRQRKELVMMDKKCREEKKRYEYELQRLNKHIRDLSEQIHQMFNYRRYMLEQNRRLLIENNVLRTNIGQTKKSEKKTTSVKFY